MALAWLSSSEKAVYKLFDSSGLPIGSGVITGVTDSIDQAVTLIGSGSISRIEFSAQLDKGTSDFLINSISYATLTKYPVTITAMPSDSDHSESITGINVIVSDNATLSVGTHNADGSWTLPLVSNGSYNVMVDSTTHAVTISGLEMTVPVGTTTTPSVIVAATVVDGTNTMNAITGTTGNDIINGSDSDDILSAGLGNDTLKGNASHDTLIGGAGNDTLTGGSGADSFVWSTGHTGKDVITDFNTTEDRIDLHDLLVGENNGNILSYLHVDIATSTLQISSNGTLAADGSNADVTIKLENNGAPVDLSGYGSSSSAIINSLIAGSDPTIKVDHNS